MKLTVQYYSRLKDLTSSEEERLEVEPGLSVQGLLRRLYLRHAGLGAWNAHLLVAVDVDYVERGHVLKDGDVISVMPPVQGG
jgi:molybdopterin converting factor small subunit